MKAFRIIGRSFRDAFKSVFRNFSLSMASILCATITLLVVSITLVIAGNINNTTKNLEKELTIIVYLEKSSTEEDVTRIKAAIEEMDEVATVSYKSKDEWKLEMSQYNSSFGTVFENYEDNPLLDSFTVTVKDAKNLAVTTESIKKIEKVDTANYGESAIDTIVSVFDIVEKATLVIMIALIFVTAFLITNTIKLTIYSRRSEIEIMRLVGASNIAIKMPFVIEGFLIGVIGSLIPVIVTIYGYIIAYEKLDGHILTDILRLIEPTPFIFYSSLLVVALGAVIGMLGSLNAVRKYLKI
jgi:cell division transport system permease protein